ncbi:MAG: 3-ketoacyl-(acyl-carrier-protein) reductase [Methanoregula sp. PtaU1.Bin051]|nr:MAG: 3-ketoacyl-(acyl-carrier-protein) reductase [Methanoregula sp. PtaU1.Bin051]
MIAGDFAQKIAIVTGGTSGIGYAVAEELLKRGATVRVIGSRAIFALPEYRESLAHPGRIVSVTKKEAHAGC